MVVRVAADEATIVNNREMPDICLQHMVAVMLLDKTVILRAAHDIARMKDPAVLAPTRQSRIWFDDEALENACTPRASPSSK